MKKKLLTAALAATGLLTHVTASATAVPVLTLIERDDSTLDWYWDDIAIGSGTFVTTVDDWWNGFTIPLPGSISEGFYGRWQETFPGHRNDVYISSSAPGQATLYVTSDLVDFSPTLAALGSALDSDYGSYQVIFKDEGDHHAVPTPDSGSASLMLVASLGALACIRRPTSALRSRSA